MAFSLSLGDDFFNGDPLAVPVECEPESVFEALEQMPDDDWNEMCAHIFPDVMIDYIDIDDVMQVIRETNTCTNLDSPVEVWIDVEGDFKINVY
jgi:hypothetical protein